LRKVAIHIQNKSLCATFHGWHQYVLLRIDSALRIDIDPLLAYLTSMHGQT
jgi:hypothetical protein